MAQSYSVDLGLDIVPFSKDPLNSGDLYRLYNAVKSLAAALDSYTGAVGADSEDYSIAGTEFLVLQRMSRIYVKFDAAASVGQLIALNSTGNAILSVVGTVIGWAPAAVVSGAYGEVRLFGMHTNVSGLTPGTRYYASATAGGLTSTVTGQKVGFAITSTKLFFNPY